MLVAKLGGVPAHPANVHRLLHDEEQLVLVFPEGRKGTEKLYKDRYRLRRFGRGGFVESAMKAKAPIVPVAVVGAEEAMPVFGHIGLAQKLTGLIYFPVTPTFPLLGAVRRPRLPAGEVQASASWSPSRPTSGARTRTRTRASCRPWPRRSAAGSRRSSTRWSPRAGRCGSDEIREAISKPRVHAPAKPVAHMERR